MLKAKVNFSPRGRSANVIDLKCTTALVHSRGLAERFTQKRCFGLATLHAEACTFSSSGVPGRFGAYARVRGR